LLAEGRAAVSDESSPTIRRRELGHLLRELRHRSGLSIEAVAERMYCSAAKISRLEQAKRSISLRDVRDLCMIYGVGDAERERLMTLARESRQRAWWQDYDIPYATYVGLEAAAATIYSYESAALPGLLQTGPYASALIAGLVPDVTPDVIDQQVEARMTRQRVLTRDAPPPPTLMAIMDENALVRPIGSPEIMHDQMSHLLEKARLPHISVLVIPLSVGAHPGLSTTFTILGLPEQELTDVVYVESPLLGHLYLDRDADVQRFHDAWERLGKFALSEDESLARIEVAADQYAPE
jgi:transcriptional regulator with XRE-family HTH domain